MVHERLWTLPSKWYQFTPCDRAPLIYPPIWMSLWLLACYPQSTVSSFPFSAPLLLLFRFCPLCYLSCKWKKLLRNIFFSYFSQILAFSVTILFSPGILTKLYFCQSSLFASSSLVYIIFLLQCIEQKLTDQGG